MSFIDDNFTVGYSGRGLHRDSTIMRSSVRRNALINIGGSVSQMAVALVTTPLYLHRIGADRFGILAIVWIFIGYFGLFDMGLGQATTMLVAKLRRPEQRSTLFWTALTVNGGLGLIASSAVFPGGWVFVAHMTVPPVLLPEILGAIPWLAISVLVGVLSSVIAGSVAGRELFFALSICSLAGMIAFTVSPLVVAFMFRPDLRLLIPAAVLARVGATLPLALVAWRFVPLDTPRFDRRWLRPLFGFGGWVAVTNVVGPILSSLDRVVIATISGPTAVTYYTVPFNLASRVLVIPSAVLSAIFPRFSKLRGSETEELARRALLGLSAVMTPIVVFGIFVMKGFLWHWIGPKLANTSAPVGEAILVGAWVNGMAYIPYAVLNGNRRPNVIARIHLVELAPFIALLALFLHVWGVYGAAWAWTLRTAADAVLLFAFSGLRLRSYALLVPSGLLVVCSAVLIRVLDARPVAVAISGAAAVCGATVLAYRSAPEELRSRVIGTLRCLTLRPAA